MGRTKTASDARLRILDTADRLFYAEGVRAVGIDRIIEPRDHSALSVGAVHFTPGAHTAWHAHQGGQTLYVTEGNGLVQSRGEEIIEIRAGDVHVTPDGQDHWHGAAPNRFMTHLAMLEVDDQGNPATWGEHVTDEEYSAGRSQLGAAVN